MIRKLRIFRSAPVMLIVTALVAALACGAAKGGAVPQETAAVARVGGSAIDRADLEQHAAPQLEQVEIQKLQCEVSASKNRHDVLRVNLEEMVRSELATREAAKVSQTAEEWRAAQRIQRMATVTDEQIQQIMARNRQLQQRKREEVEPQIRAYLAEESLFAELKAGTEVEYLLEPYRIPVEAGNGAAKGGPAAAPVTIVEFSDFQCPYCRQVNPSIETTLAKYGDKVRLVFRQFPLTSIHPMAFKAAEAALCARDQGKFWELHDKMFDDQKKLGVDDLKETARALGLQEKAFNECLDSDRFEGEVESDLRAGAVAGVNGTPALFVNGRPLSGAVSPEQLAVIIDEELGLTGK